MKEKDLQDIVVTYLDLKKVLYTCTLGGVFLGKNNFKQKQILKRHYSKGVPDILIFEPNKKYHGLMIELKVGYNKPTKEQKNWITKLNMNGYKAVVCYTIDQVIHVLKEYRNE
tara:strand:+ start:13 stop:351 length:339 start_codon:yes stop_codon:yes gene_type:complete